MLAGRLGLSVAACLFACEQAVQGDFAEERTPGARETPRDAEDARAQLPDSGLPQTQPDPTADAGAAPRDGSAAAPAPPAEEHPEFAFEPSNVELGESAFDAAPSAILDCGQVRIDTSAIVAFEGWCGTPPETFIQKQAGGPDVFVVPLRDLTVEQGTELVLRGERPIAFLVQGNVTIRGAVDASADQLTPGAGGGRDCGASAGGDAKGREGFSGGGGGGGGFGTGGGPGGDDQGQRATPGTEGSPRGNPELVPLLAGCSGGYGGGCAGRRGAGGGALQISASGTLVVEGAIRVDGGDGARGCYISAGGTGGGSGGGLLLEAQAIDLTGGVLSAIGGAGGAGEKAGDPGAGATDASESGGSGTAAGFGAGAGGGGFGRIRLRSATACTGC